jgi:hypothetical protein
MSSSKRKSSTKVLAVSSRNRSHCVRCDRSYSYLRKLGQGAFGSVHEACEKSSNRCGFVVKVQDVTFPDFKRQFCTEAAIMKTTRAMHVGPRYVDSWICQGRGYIIMDKWESSAGTFFDRHGLHPAEIDSCMQQLKAITRKLNKRKILHGDSHFGNVLTRMHRGKRQYGLADWGLSWNYQKHPTRPLRDMNRFRSFTGEIPVRFDPLFAWFQLDHAATREFGSRGRLLPSIIVYVYRQRYLKAKRQGSLRKRSTTRASRHPHMLGQSRKVSQSGKAKKSRPSKAKKSRPSKAKKSRPSKAKKSRPSKAKKSRPRKVKRPRKAKKTKVKQIRARKTKRS